MGDRGMHDPDGFRLEEQEFVSESTVSCFGDNQEYLNMMSSGQNEDVRPLSEHPPNVSRWGRNAPAANDQQSTSRRSPATSTERSRKRRARATRENIAPQSASIQVEAHSTIIVGSPSASQHPLKSNWDAATNFFRKEFIENEFGHKCDVCERLWFKRDLRQVRESHLGRLNEEFGSNCDSFVLCGTCFRALDKNQIPLLSVTNGFRYPLKPPSLPVLNPISKRLISPRIPFMNIRRLQRDGNLGIVGQVINIPVDVDSMVRHLPRNLDDDYAINVSIRRKLFHKSTYLSGSVKKSELKVWLDYLINQPLYKAENIKIEWENFDRMQNELGHLDSNFIEDIPQSASENVSLMSNQQTVLWNEDSVLDIAPGQFSRPLNFAFDQYAEELSFPHIYYGVGRDFNKSVKVTPFIIANSEIRRCDRRGADPEHILYVTMKIMRQRVVDGMRNSFRRVAETEGITRRMLEDRHFLNECVEKNLACLKSIPNSSQYWKSKKHELFAMIRQLGKPTIFLTLSANEMNWPHLLKVLYKLTIDSDTTNLPYPASDLDKSTRSKLVSEDPVTCCIYFKKLLDVLMNMIRAKKKHNPFGRYRVIDHFLRIEFQHRGSPHAHILLWLDNDPNEPLSENMPLTMNLMSDLCSVNEADVTEEVLKNQVHKHTFTCTKRGEATCRFHIPFWPVRQTCVLLPLSKDDGRKSRLKLKSTAAKKLLEMKNYDSFDAFIADIGLDYEQYLNMLRSTIKRPTFFFKRQPKEKMTNAFNPWIAKTLQSNMDLQIILDIYSCANYVADYVNKSNRGTSNLHRELIKLSGQFPEMDKEGLLKKIASKILNTVEMSAPEGAWHILRLPMSQSSRDCVYIPTCHPVERQRSHKSFAQLRNIDPDSTDVWTKNIIQKYESRSESLNQICLADFAALYTPKVRSANDYTKRKSKRIIRYRSYDVSDTDNYKREMVTLFVPFRNEQVDIMDRQTFIQIYDEKFNDISLKKKEYESIDNLEQIVEEMRRANQEGIVSNAAEASDRARNLISNHSEEIDEIPVDNSDGFASNVVTRIQTRRNVMQKDEYCRMMRTTNEGQRRLLHHTIHLLSLPETKPLKIFFTGPAGCGKTYVLKLLMETFNRYSRDFEEHSNSYIACASTGKAAVNLGGITVHSALHLTKSSKPGSITVESLHKLREIFRGVSCLIIDEVSMIGNEFLHSVHERLGQITQNRDDAFGSLSVVFCGDFRQLPPVMATPAYKASRSHLRGNLLWQTLDYYCLDQVMRQTDITFSTILTKIGNGIHLSESESQLLESRFRNEDWCDANLQGVIRLFHKNFMVERYNDRMLRGADIHLSVDQFSGYSSHQELTTARAKLFKCTSQETGGLPFQIGLRLNYPYMITSNIDVEDGLVNGAIGTLKHIEKIVVIDADPEENSRSRVWIDFGNAEKVGVKARMKFDHHIRRNHINPDWTPIVSKSVSINLGGSIRCRRSQLPLASACAITIHKSQGGTFDKAVIAYDKSLSNQLVYVALSRVTSIDGLFLINLEGDFKFYHKSGSDAPHIREIRDEYERLSKHKLRTLTDELLEFIKKPETGADFMIISTINAQSLVAHSQDIQTDEVLVKSDILVISETWMNDVSEVEIPGFQILSKSSEPLASPTTSIARRTAKGVAIYKNAKIDDCTVSKIDNQIGLSNSVGEVVGVTLQLDGCHFSIIAFYLHPNASKSEVENFIRQSLTHMNVDQLPRIFVSGDFNINVSKDKWLIEIMEQDFGLKYISCNLPTTIGNTTIDLTFTKGLDASTRSFVAYFSYHRPLVSKLSLRNFRE